MRARRSNARIPAQSDIVFDYAKTAAKRQNNGVENAFDYPGLVQPHRPLFARAKDLSGGCALRRKGDIYRTDEASMISFC